MKFTILPSILVIFALTLPACTKHDNRPRVSKLASAQLPLRHAEDLKRVDNKKAPAAKASNQKPEKVVKASRKPASHKAAKSKAIKHKKQAKKQRKSESKAAHRSTHRTARKGGATAVPASLVSDN